MFVLAEDAEVIVAFLPKSRRQLALPERYLNDRLFFKDFEKKVAAIRCGQEGLAMVAAAGNEVFVATGMKTSQAFGHGESL
jgi:hypothetical protein